MLLGGIGDEIEFIFLAELSARHVDDFLDVAAEMGDCVGDGREDGCVVTLDLALGQEFVGFQVDEGFVGFGHDFCEDGQDFGFWAVGTVGEFHRAIADVFVAGCAGDKPLAEVSGEVEG